MPALVQHDQGHCTGGWDAEPVYNGQTFFNGQTFVAAQTFSQIRGKGAGTMKKIAQSTLAVLLLLSAAPVARADDSGAPPSTATSSDPGVQFKAAGQHIGTAAKQIGEGVKEGAVRTWEAVKAGANAAGQKLNGESGSARSPDVDRDSTR
jgi:hypothetical protein